MTLRELYSIPFLEKEIASYKEKIRELEEIAESITPKLTGMPRGGGISDKVGECATAIAYYQNFLNAAIFKKTETECRITQFIEGIEDAEVRRIIYLRFVERKEWQEVADDVGGYSTEDSVRKKCNRYINKNVSTSDMSDVQAV